MIPAWRRYDSKRESGLDERKPEDPVWWAALKDPPEVGTRVVITAWGAILGTVVGYETGAGWLMIKVRPDTRPFWHIKDNPGRDVCVFAGIELEW